MTTANHTAASPPFPATCCSGEVPPALPSRCHSNQVFLSCRALKLNHASICDNCHKRPVAVLRIVPTRSLIIDVAQRSLNKQPLQHGEARPPVAQYHARGAAPAQAITTRCLSTKAQGPQTPVIPAIYVQRTALRGNIREAATGYTDCVARL